MSETSSTTVCPFTSVRAGRGSLGVSSSDHKGTVPDLEPNNLHDKTAMSKVCYCKRKTLFIINVSSSNVWLASLLAIIKFAIFYHTDLIPIFVWK